MKKILIAAVAGGLIVFTWTAIAHMATPLGTAGMSVFPQDQESKIIDAMKAGLPGSGLYFFPGIDMRSTPTPEQQKAWEAKIQSGPSAFSSSTLAAEARCRPRSSSRSWRARCSPPRSPRISRLSWPRR
jgi:hypothetical protein